MSDHDPAFPIIPRPFMATKAPDGLTKRELFAAMAMQAILSNPKMSDCAGGVWPKRAYHATAQCAIKQADALLEELQKDRGDQSDP